ncbi:PRTRC system ThiF family protein [Curvibacter sp. APW13]|uniref:PRTRC system ThiF family protein n=1 Tax=Curvibacter sp. APW13 TaxID=3077236 RepID=UPI0028DD9E17|nr:PRTRC system ThiF family protein [Curvibacter sp. APW13]MDT8992822.1 PRTRC system ThiF family protein [Curvibacter sp. APW13]
MLVHQFRTSVGKPPGLVITYDTIHLIGAGGNGAPMLMRLHKIHTTLRALGRSGLKVIVWDMDTVSPSNIGRQPFYPADIGRNKADVLISRLKMIDPSIHHWQARSERFTQDSEIGNTLMVITCVDNKEARRAVHRAVFETERALYWLDLGNEADSGQIVLGEAKHLRRTLRLPVVTELYPEILDESIPEDDSPSCSTEEAIRKQGLFVNEIVVGHAADLIWEGLHKGTVTKPVIYVSTMRHTVNSVGIDPEFYKRKGFKPGRRNNPLIIKV